jgi:hypothetical protein
MEIKHTLANIRKNIAEGKYKTHPRTEGTSTEESVQDLAEVELRAQEQSHKFLWDSKYAI